MNFLAFAWTRFLTRPLRTALPLHMIIWLAFKTTSEQALSIFDTLKYNPIEMSTCGKKTR